MSRDLLKLISVSLIALFTVSMDKGYCQSNSFDFGGGILLYQYDQVTVSFESQTNLDKVIVGSEKKFPGYSIESNFNFSMKDSTWLLGIGLRTDRISWERQKWLMAWGGSPSDGTQFSYKDTGSFIGNERSFSLKLNCTKKFKLSPSLSFNLVVGIDGVFYTFMSETYLSGLTGEHFGLNYSGRRHSPYPLLLRTTGGIEVEYSLTPGKALFGRVDFTKNIVSNSKYYYDNSIRGCIGFRKYF